MNRRRLLIASCSSCAFLSASKVVFGNGGPQAIVPCGADITHKGATREKTSRTSFRAFGGNVIGKPLVAELQSRLWKNGQRLNVLFLDGTSEQKEAVEVGAKEWEKHANVAFRFHSKKPKSTQIAITFKQSGYSSYRGTVSEYFASDGKASMVLQDTFEQRHILHEFGHALGLYHEHQSPKAKIYWDEDAVYKYYADNHNWDEKTIKNNILTPATEVSATSPFDPDSIMIYAIPASLTTNGVSTNYNEKLSATDKLYIAKLYPKNPCKKCGGKGYALVRVGGGGGRFGRGLGLTTAAVCTTCKGTGND